MQVSSTTVISTTTTTTHSHTTVKPLKVAVIGSGNWGTCIARVVGQNVADSIAAKSSQFQEIVTMYVYQEKVLSNQNLTDVINTQHCNIKYLPGVLLPHNIVADSSLVSTVTNADVLIFVMPHQFVTSLCKQMQGHLAPGCIAISLIKGFDYDENTSNIKLMSQHITSILNIPCCSLSGANVAADVASEQFSETTIGYTREHVEHALLFQQLFDRPYFKVNAVPDVAGVELCGALKNIIALAAGFVDGLKLGSNTKAAVIRLGLVEMRLFASLFFHDVIDETFWDSSGVADLITTCFGGRNRKCAELFVRSAHKDFAVIEREVLNGQKLQGTGTAKDVFLFLQSRQQLHQFPLMTAVYRVAAGQADADEVIKVFMTKELRPIVAVTQSKL